MKSCSAALFSEWLCRSYAKVVLKIRIVPIATLSEMKGSNSDTRCLFDGFVPTTREEVLSRSKNCFFNKDLQVQSFPTHFLKPALSPRHSGANKNHVYSSDADMVFSVPSHVPYSLFQRRACPSCTFQRSVAHHPVARGRSGRPFPRHSEASRSFEPNISQPFPKLSSGGNRKGKKTGNDARRRGGDELFRATMRGGVVG